MWKNIFTYLIINQENDSDISALKRKHYSLHLQTCSIYFEDETPLDKCEKKPPRKNFRRLTVGEIKTAEHQIIVQAHREYYHKELNSLRNNKLLLKNSTLSSLRPMLTNNSLRAGVESTSLVFTI